jgi:transcription termination factor Rho
MSLPPKTDDEISAPDDGAKPAKRGRPRARKAAGEPEAAVREETQPAIFVPERRPEPEAAPQPAPAPQQQDSGASRDVASEQTGANDGRQGDGQGQGQTGGGGQGQGGGRGEWQDRNSWKRNKRKRGRHGGGPWQQGPGGGGGGAPRYPQQPPPPTPAPVYGDLPSPSRFADLAALDALASEIGSAKGEPLYLDHLYALNLADLTAFARTQKVSFEGAPNRLQLLPQIFAKATEDKRALGDRGYVDMTDQGAFIVHEHVNYRLYPEDAYLPESLIRRYGLKRGHHVEVRIQPPREGERCPSVIRIDQVMGHDPEDISKVTPFEELIPYYPLKRILLEDTDIQKDVSMRAVDILTPIGFGQRGLIVAPPRTGKTILLQNIANSVSENSPFAKLILLLVDERPEEVTDFRRHTKGEVVSSTFDEAPESHVHCAEMVGEKARRLVEQGEHVVILLDSITRLARAYNALASSSGKIMSGGLESNALQKPKRFFGAARNIEGAGSLTIIATALVDTGSRADEIIFEEFKGTGNMELHLDRGLVERRIFPAINIDRSGTRKEELIYHPEELQRIYGLRRAMQGLGPIESMEMLIQRLKKTKSNAEFLLGLSR